MLSGKLNYGRKSAKLTYRWLKSEINRIGEEGGRTEEEVHVSLVIMEGNADDVAKRTLDQSYRFIPRSQDPPRRSSHRRDGSRKDQARMFSRRFCKVSCLCLQSNNEADCQVISCRTGLDGGMG